MIYIHMLRDLSIKAADIESVSMLRDIKNRRSLPLSEPDFAADVAPYLVSKTDIEVMSACVDELQITMQKIVELSKTGSASFEMINLKRALDIINEVPHALTKNIDYATRMLEWEPMLIPVFTALLNDIPTLETQEQKEAYDKRLSSIFERIFRMNEVFSFRYDDLIHEAHITHVGDLLDGLKEGFFFHVKLEEHIKHQDFGTIRHRIPEAEMQKVAEINDNLLLIKKSISRAYDVNMRMIELSIFLYTYIKWAREQSSQ